MDYTIIVAATASEPAPSSSSHHIRVLRWANTSVTAARHALIIYDDLSKQALPTGSFPCCSVALPGVKLTR